MRISLLALPAIVIFSLPLGADAQAKAKAKAAPPPLPTCGPLPEHLEARPWDDTERLYYDVDVMGALAGKLMLMAHPPSRVGSEVVVLRAMAASNSFFSKIRAVRGRAASHFDARTFRPRLYNEETKEGEIERSAQVRFDRSPKGKAMALEYKRNGRSNKKRFTHAHEAFDPLSAFYALRGMKLAEGQSICFDAYGIRHHWRVSGKVVAKEMVKVPAGAFTAFRIEGKALRVDDPRKSREVHVWISADEKRLPLAALGVMDLGPVRAQLTRVGGEVDEEFEDAVVSGIPMQKAPRPAQPLRLR